MSLKDEEEEEEEEESEGEATMFEYVKEKITGNINLILTNALLLISTKTNKKIK